MFTPLDTACANILDYSSKYFCDYSDYSHHLAQRSEGAPGDALLAPGRAGGRALAVTRHTPRGGRAVGGLLVSWGRLGGGLHLRTPRAQLSSPCLVAGHLCWRRGGVAHCPRPLQLALLAGSRGLALACTRGALHCSLGIHVDCDSTQGGSGWAVQRAGDCLQNIISSISAQTVSPVRTEDARPGQHMLSQAAECGGGEVTR